MYNVYLPHRVEKELFEIPEEVRKEIVKILFQLKSNPRPPGDKKLKGELEGVYKL